MPGPSVFHCLPAFARIHVQPKAHTLNLKKQPGKPKLKGVLHNNRPVFFKNVDVIQENERQRKCFRLQDTKETSHLMQHSILS